ncbi:MAG: hypothetical protein K9H25_21715 [Rhodospirillum sp.]|nr:hypothetical protein [Rhodospirillum sp.]MCF8491172.1 hypothetical protein [Rhodospirillum sp.]MCF8502496.1 hypothetical protein [Rhodospirillum sp.]
MNKKGLIAIAVVGVLGVVGAVGYGLVQTKGEEKVRSMLAGFQKSLPPNTTLDYETLSISPAGLSLTMGGVRVNNPVEHLAGTVKEITLSNPGFSGATVKTIDMEVDGAEISMARPQASLTVKVDHVEVEDVDIRESIALGKMFKGLKSAGDLEPEAMSRINVGPSQVRNLDVTVSSENTHMTIGAIDMDGVERGVLGRLSYKDYLVEKDGARLSLDSLALEGIDLIRLAHWAKDAEARMKRGEPPVVDTLGLTLLDMAGVRMEGEGHAMAVDHMAITDLESIQGLPVRVSLVIEGLHIPAGELDEETKAFLSENGQSDLVVNLAYGHALDQEKKTLVFGPATLDLGVLGQYGGTLALAGLDVDMLVTAQERPERLLDSARLDSVTVKAVAGSGTASYADRLLAKEGMDRAALATLVDQRVGTDLRQTLGAEFGDRLVTALTAFISNPGTFTLSAKAQEEPMNMNQLGMGLALVPQRVLQAYNVQVDYAK